MAGVKVKGPGGIGQWDTGTANQDIRAPLRKSQSSGSGPSIGSKAPRTYLTPYQRKAQKQAEWNRAHPSRKKVVRSKGRAKRR